MSWHKPTNDENNDIGDHVWLVDIQPGAPESVYHAPDLRRVLDKIVIADGCYEYEGAHVNGYAVCKFAQRHRQVHRLLYEHLVGPVPRDRDIHHVCRNKGCVNLDHLALMSRAFHAKQHLKERCPQGHLYVGANLYVNPQGGRECRACHRKRKREAWRLKNWGAVECA